jgi:Recombination endonuclease VII
MKLTVKEKGKYRNDLLQQQNNLCPLCGTVIFEGEQTLDHDHSTGKVRRVLHRSCNQAEGRILSWIRRSRATDPLEFLEALVRYWQEDYSDMPEHPTHKNEFEIKLSKLKRKLRSLKTERGKARCRDQIQKLKNTYGES